MALFPADPPDDVSTPGTRGIERVSALLRVLATRTQYGWALTQLAEEAGLKKTTAHRMLGKLEAEGLVSRRSSDSRYFLGAAIAEMSLGLPGFHGFMEASAKALEALATATGAAAMLALRSGTCSVVAARAGASERRGMMTEVGGRRPLLASSAGTAIFLGLSCVDRAHVVRANMEALKPRSRGDLEALARMWYRSHELGYGCSRGEVIPGVTSVAVAMRSPDGIPFASIALVDEAETFSEVRAQKAVAAIRHEIEVVMSRNYPDTWFDLFGTDTPVTAKCADSNRSTCRNKPGASG